MAEAPYPAKAPPKAPTAPTKTTSTVAKKVSPPAPPAPAPATETSNKPPVQDVTQFSDSTPPGEADAEPETEPEGSSESEATDGSAEPASTETTKAEEPTYKLKIDGEETEKTLTEVLKMAEKAAGADARFREAAEIQKGVNHVLELLNPQKGKPEDVLLDLWRAYFGGDKAKAEEVQMAMVDRLLSRWVERDKLTPAEKKALELEQQLQERERELQALREREEGERFEAAVARETDVVAGEIRAAMKALAVEDTEANIEGVLEAWTLLRQTGEMPTAEDATQEFLRRLRYRDDSEKRRVVESSWKDIENLPDEEVLGRVPQAVRDKILKASLGKTKADRRPSPARLNTGPTTAQPERPTRVPSYRFMAD